MTDKLREALADVCLYFPTDVDMVVAGWEKERIEKAWVAYDKAFAALAAPAAAPPLEPPITVQELRNIVRANRFDRDHFPDADEFGAWVQNRARFALYKIGAAEPDRDE